MNLILSGEFRPNLTVASRAKVSDEWACSISENPVRPLLTSDRKPQSQFFRLTLPSGMMFTASFPMKSGSTKMSVVS
jgi:hypothetical protein